MFVSKFGFCVTLFANQLKMPKCYTVLKRKSTSLSFWGEEKRNNMIENGNNLNKVENQMKLFHFIESRFTKCHFDFSAINFALDRGGSEDHKQTNS